MPPSAALAQPQPRTTLPARVALRRPCPAAVRRAQHRRLRSAAPVAPAHRPAVAAAAAAAAGGADPAVADELPLAPQQPVIKVCGVTNAEDAAAAAQAGANLIGMILWPKAKRSIPAATAREVAGAARRHGAEPVGVFVDEDAATIQRVCAECSVRIAQLHGDGARAALAGLPPGLATIYVMHADPAGRLQTPPPPSDAARRPRWIIVDGLQGGSGEAFDWRQLRAQAPSFAPLASHGWLLAGGLTPDSVAEAVATAGPTGVDVSSGVCGPDGLKKDVGRVQRYCGAAAAAFQQAAAAVAAEGGQQ